jgi:hypothetical protein
MQRRIAIGGALRPARRRFLYPWGGAALLVSAAGGSQPRWRRNGKELFYVAADGKLMSVPVAGPTNTQMLGVGAPVALFPTHLAGGGGFPKQQYAVAPDGQRFFAS